MFITIILKQVDNSDLPRYKKIDTFKNRLNEEVRIIWEIVKNNEKIAQYEHNLYWSYEGKNWYDRNGWYLLQQKYYCAKNISEHVDEVSKRTWIYTYEADYRKIVEIEEFKKYLHDMDAECVSLEENHFSWWLFTDKMNIWGVSYLKTAGSLLLTLFSVGCFGLFVLIIYYKIFIYIIFWKNHQK